MSIRKGGDINKGDAVEQITEENSKKIKMEDVYVVNVEFMRGFFNYTIIVLVIVHCLGYT
jgi:hypothetical protein